MAVAAHKGAISFGLVHIPIAMYRATQEERISFNQLHAGCGARVKHKKYCPVHDREISGDEIVKWTIVKKVDRGMRKISKAQPRHARRTKVQPD